MKAEMPGSRIAIEKYGMPASEAHHIVERHFTVVGEEQLFTALAFDHAVRAGPAVRACLDRIKRGPQPALVCDAPPQPATEAEPVSAQPQSLRELLGLK